MAHNWNDSAVADSPAEEPEKPVRLLSLAEATALVPPEAAAYLRRQLKTEISRVRAYRPTRVSRENP